MHENKRLKIFTWHIHGSYLYYLTQTPVDFYLPVTGDNTPGYGGRAGTFPWTDNVYEIAIKDIKNHQFDIIVYQSDENYLNDQHRLFTKDQIQNAGKIYIEHDPPQEHPTNTKHIVDDPNVLIVHVTCFNQLMWDNNNCQTMVIEHGVKMDPKALYTGEKTKGIVVINNMAKRGRRLGIDIYREVRKHIPLDAIGMNSTEIDGGIGEIPPDTIQSFIGKYRFFFNPIRYTSMGLAVCEAMMVGMPIVGLATTEMVTVIKNNYNGFIDTNIDRLILNMQRILDDADLAKEWGENAAHTAKDRFGIERFKKDWLQLFKDVIGISDTRFRNTQLPVSYY